MRMKQGYEIDKDSHYKSKKYVVKIFPENLKKIESLDLRERDQFVNDAISAYQDQYNAHKHQVDFLDRIKKNIFQIISLIILFALVAAVLRFAMVCSDANTAEMGNNFQRFYDNSHLRQ